MSQRYSREPQSKAQRRGACNNSLSTGCGQREAPRNEKKLPLSVGLEKQRKNRKEKEEKRREKRVKSCAVKGAKPAEKGNGKRKGKARRGRARGGGKVRCGKVR